MLTLTITGVAADSSLVRGGGGKAGRLVSVAMVAITVTARALARSDAPWVRG